MKIQTKDPVSFRVRNSYGVELIQFAGLSELDYISHAYSTRIGGVSKEPYATMNLRFGHGDSDENVRENFHLFCDALQVPYDSMVFSRQTHTTNVRYVKKEDRGNGICFPNRFQDVDGLVTDVPGLALVTCYADCVPLYFVDQRQRAIGLSHSGWRGTVDQMAAFTLAKMKECFQTNPQDVLAVIGPSICKDCFEVGEEVAEKFAERMPKVFHRLATRKENGKYHISLQEANRHLMLQQGILPENIIVSSLCTKCHPELFFSHRRLGAVRGGQVAVLMLREK